LFELSFLSLSPSFVCCSLCQYKKGERAFEYNDEKARERTEEKKSRRENEVVKSRDERRDERKEWGVGGGWIYIREKRD